MRRLACLKAEMERCWLARAMLCIASSCGPAYFSASLPVTIVWTSSGLQGCTAHTFLAAQHTNPHTPHTLTIPLSALPHSHTFSPHSLTPTCPLYTPSLSHSHTHTLTQFLSTLHHSLTHHTPSLSLHTPSLTHFLSALHHSLTHHNPSLPHSPHSLTLCSSHNSTSMRLQATIIELP